MERSAAPQLATVTRRSLQPPSGPLSERLHSTNHGKYSLPQLGGPAYNALSDTCRHCARDAFVYKPGQDITEGCWGCACCDGSQMCGCAWCPAISPLGLIKPPETCIDCAAGTYADAPAASACTSCPDGSTSPPGSSSASACTTTGPPSFEVMAGGDECITAEEFATHAQQGWPTFADVASLDGNPDCISRQEYPN
jgi:hypothetical protein